MYCNDTGSSGMIQVCFDGTYFAGSSLVPNEVRQIMVSRIKTLCSFIRLIDLSLSPFPVAGLISSLCRTLHS